MRRPADVLGPDGLEAFLPFTVVYHRYYTRQAFPDFWYWDYSAEPPKEGEVGTSTA